MKLVLHRSITFWSGIIVMVFICWAWRDSKEHWSCSTFKSWHAQHYKSAFIFGSNDHTTPLRWQRLPASAYPIQEEEYFPAPYLTWGSERRYVHALTAMQREQRTLREKTLGLMEKAKRHIWMSFIPHWLILLAVGAVWLGLLFWRARRRRKVLS